MNGRAVIITAEIPGIEVEYSSVAAVFQGAGPSTVGRGFHGWQTQLAYHNDRGFVQAGILYVEYQSDA